MPLPTARQLQASVDLTPARLEMRERVRGSNIDDKTLLATDYLNHFNEVTMLLEMVADMPDLLDDVKAWQPKSYAQHFRDSGLSIADMAIEAYDLAPGRYRIAFDETVEQMNALVEEIVIRIESALAGGNTDAVREAAVGGSRDLQSLIDIASGIIHGKVAAARPGARSQITSAVDEQPENQYETEEEEVTLDQAAIDALFE